MEKTMFFIISCCLLTACSSSHLIYGHNTVLGLDVVYSPENTGKLIFGYDRDTFALVPRKAKNQDAMTLTSFGCVYVDGLNEINFNHFVSTGESAKNIANHPDGLKTIKSSIFGGGVKCE